MTASPAIMPDPTCGVGAAVRSLIPFAEDNQPGELVALQLQGARLAVRRAWRDQQGGLRAEIRITVRECRPPPSSF